MKNKDSFILFILSAAITVWCFIQIEYQIKEVKIQVEQLQHVAGVTQ